MIIRLATADDYHGAVLLQRAVMPNETRYHYAGNICQPGTLNLVADRSDAVVGYISVLVGQADPNGAHLWQRLRPYVAFMGVLPDSQGHGVGTGLIRRASNMVLPSDQPRLWLECNQDVANFYERLGFVSIQPDMVRGRVGLSPKGLLYCLYD